MEQFVFRRSEPVDLDRIWTIILQAKDQMYREKKHQWDESYPTYELINDDIAKGYGYSLCMDGDVIAYAAVVFDGEPAYNDIDGKWLSDNDYVVVHRLAVAEEVKRRGIAKVYMDEVEKLAIGKGITSFKIDTNYDNFYMQKLLARCGFTYCGEILYGKGMRMAYEKLLTLI